MISRSEIMNLTDSTSYFKGEELYENSQVLGFELYEDKERAVDHIYGTVSGSGRKQYSVMLDYNKAKGYLEDLYCECPIYHNYGSVCRHCVAIMLEYMDYVNICERTSLDYEPMGRSQILPGQSGGTQSRKQPVQITVPRTTPKMQELLMKRKKQRELPFVQQESYGKVRLEPTLEFLDPSNINVEFKIGVSYMYVLKDVLSFLTNLSNQAEYKYGAKLNIVHSMEMFDEGARSLIRFLQSWMSQNGDRYLGYSNYSRYYSYAALRYISLTLSELEQFLEAMGERDFQGHVQGHKEYSWKCTREPLPRMMKITGSENGAEIQINQFSGYLAKNSVIYFFEGKIYLVPREEIAPIEDFIEMMADIPTNTIFIENKDLPAFCRDLLPELERCYACTKENFNERDYAVTPATFEFYLDSPQRDMITCKPVAVYGDKKYDVYGQKADIDVRDPIREMEIERIVSSYCNAYDESGRMMVAAGDEEMQYELLVNGIPRLQQLGEVFISDALKKIKVESAPRVSIGVSLSGDLLQLSMTAGEMSKEQLIEILCKYDRKKKYYRLKNGDFINMDGEDFQVLVKLKNELALTDAQLKKDTVTLPKYRALYLDGELREQQGLSASKDRSFKTLIRNMKTVEDNDFEIPKFLDDVLREYQKRGFLWLKTLRNNGFGGILADDMGLGKTLQVIAFLASEFQEAAAGENRRSLVVCPASLVFNWNSEFQRFAPDLPVKMVVGTAAERHALIKQADERVILITSYDLLKRDMEYYEDLTFFCQVADEAQYIKNHNTQAAKTVKAVQASFKLALTGTPVENRLSELWSIFDYLMPGFLYSYQRFRETLEQPIVQYQDEEAQERLQKMIRPFVLRRLKGDVLKELPDKLEKCVYAKLSGEQQKLYDAHVARMKLMLENQSDEEFKTSKIQILSELTKLRQICCDPGVVFENYDSGSVKMDMCLDLVENAIEGGHKILIFSQFTTMLDRIEEKLSAKNIPFYVLTGSVSKEKRIKMVDAFNQDDTPVFCVSLKAGGTGLNLTAADIVIHYDPWWNLAVQNQATDRAHRIGQKNVVMVYKLIVQGTIEENIIKLQERNRELADQILSGDGMGSGSFSKEELLSLL